ncbi:MAG TPA: Hsp20/alpha crystallin family protein [Candidatus Dormibacteraeota bacterium]|nr:Hsp20/alpha crystallin family protein [Candidatus Dormibacteraeota bacterium]
MNGQEVTRTDTQQRVYRRTPDVEVFEDDQALFVSADVPGVQPGHVEVSLDDGVLSVAARVEQRPGDAGITTEFRRRFTLREPSRYDADHISATLHHGVLELRLPKSERSRRRQIPVTVQ